MFDKNGIAIYCNPMLTESARKLRKNMTDEERHLWFDFLSSLPVRVKRQVVIGNYIVDFLCLKKMIVIEVDGSQHYNSEKSIQNDKERDTYLANLGFTVLRYTNRDIHTNFRGVCEDIYNHLKL